MNTVLLAKKIKKEAGRNNIDVGILADTVHGVMYMKKGNTYDGHFYLDGKPEKVVEVAENIVQFISDVEATR